MAKEDIHSLVVYDKTDKLVTKWADIELEVAADIVETTQDIPYIGSLYKLGKIGFSAFSYFHYTKKLASFLKNAINTTIEERQAFVDGMSEEMREKSAEYITAVLVNSEDTEKATILGLIYRAAVLGQIDAEMMLRLTSVVNRSYVRDFRLIDIPAGTECNYDDSIISNFIACGLIEDQTGAWHDDSLHRDADGSWSHHFNDTGLALYKILKDAGWYD